MRALTQVLVATWVERAAVLSLACEQHLDYPRVSVDFRMTRFRRSMAFAVWMSCGSPDRRQGTG